MFRPTFGKAWEFPFSGKAKRKKALAFLKLYRPQSDIPGAVKNVRLRRSIRFLRFHRENLP
jgi:hypothetical protein